MEDEGLADGAPRHRVRPQVEGDHEQDGDGERHRRVHRVNEETHRHASQKAEQRRVRREVAERRPETRAARLSRLGEIHDNYYAFLSVFFVVIYIPSVLFFGNI